MADEKIYCLGVGSSTLGFKNDSDGNPPESAHFVWEDGAWVKVPMDEDHYAGLNGLMKTNDPPYAILLVPHTAITFDSDNNVNAVELPG